MGNFWRLEVLLHFDCKVGFINVSTGKYGEYMFMISETRCNVTYVTKCMRTESPKNVELVSKLCPQKHFVRKYFVHSIFCLLRDGDYELKCVLWFYFCFKLSGQFRYQYYQCYWKDFHVGVLIFSPRCAFFLNVCHRVVDTQLVP